MSFSVQRGVHGANLGVLGAVLRLSDLLGGLSWVAGKSWVYKRRSMLLKI